MKDFSKYQGIIPAFYACYDKEGKVDGGAVRALARYLLDKGVKGLYVGGSSGECIYQSAAERKLTLENVMAEVGGKLTIIAHVACNNTADSQELAAHAESLGVDAIAAIPPIYFHLPPKGIAKYWNDISAAAPNTDFVIYNIPQLAGVTLSVPLLQEMMKNPRVIGVKNSSMPVQDIQMWRDEGAFVFNGPDEQLLSGLAAGAGGGIGGTYAAMPELYLEILRCFQAGELEKGREVQNECCRIIYKMCSAQGNMYAVIKEIIRLQGGPDVGSVRAPLLELEEGDRSAVKEAYEMIQAAISRYCLTNS
ncbi:N-acetylneuraminate lyase [Pseudoflavonifractor sp. 60]|uniref:dihydrodipicolinate synthase family protein n=1 Tax=Pseudoflavonifractor sp. 60 TaxID=2304576 RepID=UPI00136C41C7|nr:dihydrodipicolinate synthase family protein [Pseudoflavonifractor sp. 60]NBI65579.1 N-acetylneuraminate lyase [Pseudoflavonifractor sp. 60]